MRLISQVNEEINGDLETNPLTKAFTYVDKNGPPSKGSRSAARKRNDAAHGRIENNTSGSAYPPYRIMVVDDEPDVVSVLEKGLQRYGFHVVGYTNALEALSNFARHQYDIVLTDIRMPQMNGLDLFKQLRAKDDDLLICFVTAYEQFRQEFEIAHPEEQVGCFIPKPVSINGLVEMINRKMEEREGRWRKRI